MLAVVVILWGCKDDKRQEEAKEAVSTPASSPEVTDASCETFVRRLCELEPEMCAGTQTVFEKIELPPAECRAALGELKVVEALEPAQRLPVAAQILIEMLGHSSALTEEQVRAIRAQTRAHEFRADSAPRGPAVAPVDAELPRASGRYYLRQGVLVRITETGVSVAGKPPRPPGKVAKALAAAAEQERGQTREGEEPHPKLQVHADASTPHGSLVEVLVAADAAGFVELGLAVRDGDVLSEIFLFGPSISPVARRLDAVVVSIGKAGLALAGRAVPDLEALSAAAASMKKRRADVTVAALRAEADTPVGHVVAALEAVRGPQCDLDELLESSSLSDTCWFWQPVVDLDPPIGQGIAP
jgi:biopolymer transport protein ExbD